MGGRRSPRPAVFWKWTSFGCEADQSSRPFGSCGRELAGWQEEWSAPPRESIILGAVGEVFYPAWRSPGGLEECRHHGEGRAELCGANNKRDTTPEGWLFLKLLFEGE